MKALSSILLVFLFTSSAFALRGGRDVYSGRDSSGRYCEVFLRQDSNYIPKKNHYSDFSAQFNFNSRGWGDLSFDQWSGHEATARGSVVQMPIEKVSENSMGRWSAQESSNPWSKPAHLMNIQLKLVQTRPVSAKIELLDIGGRKLVLRKICSGLKHLRFQ